MPTFRQRVEYGVVAALLGLFRALPRPAALRAGAGLASVAVLLFPKLQKTGLQNLGVAFSDKPLAWRENTLRTTMRFLGWQLAEFAHLPGWTRRTAEQLCRMEGFEHFAQAQLRGKGVLILTGHIGFWEMSSFYFALLGHPMSIVIRRLDNPLVDARVNAIRCMHGNRVLHKDDFARGLLHAMHNNETVGILMDTNMTPPQGVFVPFFGVPACTGSGLSRIALKTGAAVVPGFMVWNEAEEKYVLHFLPEVEVVRTGEVECDVLALTAACNATLESIVRQYPEQWMWLHRRWKTRPAGEHGIY